MEKAKQVLPTSAEEVEKQLNKSYGYKVIGKASEFYGKDKGLVRCPSGNWQLDLVLGGFVSKGKVTERGNPCGRIQEWYGFESSFKSSQLYLSIAAAQRFFKDKDCALVAMEEFDPVWAQNLGVDLDRLKLAEPTTGNEASDIMRALVLTGKYSIVALDSIAAAVPQEEMERSAEEYEMAAQAKMMNKMCRTLAGALNRKFFTKVGKQTIQHMNDTQVILINQQREKIGGPSGRVSYTQPGGKGKNFHASIRLEFRVVDYKETVIGSQTKQGEQRAAAKGDEHSEYEWVDIGVVGIKNKTFVKGKKCVFRLYLKNSKKHKIGDIDELLGACKWGEMLGIIRKDGAKADGEEDDTEESGGSRTWLYKDKRFNGSKAVKEYFAENPAELKELIEKILVEYYSKYTPKLLDDEVVAKPITKKLGDVDKIIRDKKRKGGKK